MLMDLLFVPADHPNEAIPSNRDISHVVLGTLHFFRPFMAVSSLCSDPSSNREGFTFNFNGKFEFITVL